MRFQKTTFAFFAAASVIAAAAFAEQDAKPAYGLYRYMAKCQNCGGRGMKVLSPPDMGQFGGGIERKSHWDVKAVCPVCGGKGRHSVLRLNVDPSDEFKDLPPCRKCGWSGVEKCRKCKGDGFVPCRGRGCRSGWIVTESSERASGGRKKPPTVTACPECHGFGKVRCADCDGCRGVQCSSCKGVGFNAKEIEKRERDKEKKARDAEKEQERKKRELEREQERKQRRERERGGR